MEFILKIVFKSGYIHISNHKREGVKKIQELHHKLTSFLVGDEDVLHVSDIDGRHYFIKSEIACISIIESN